MNDQPSQMRFHVTSRRVDAHGSLSRCKNAEVALDTDMAGNPDAFNPAELLLAALSACMIKGIERVVPILKFDLRGVQHQSPARFGNIGEAHSGKPGDILAGIGTVRIVL